MNERTIAGPAYCAAALPVRTKIPAPMMAPMPSVVRLSGPRARLSPCVVSEASASSVVTGLRRISRLDMEPLDKGQGEGMRVLKASIGLLVILSPVRLYAQAGDTPPVDKKPVVKAAADTGKYA